MEYKPTHEIRAEVKAKTEKSEEQPWRALAAAIAIQAVRDYRRLMESPNLTLCERKELGDIEKYFTGGLFEKTTGMDGEVAWKLLTETPWESKRGKRKRYTQGNRGRGGKEKN